MCSDKNIVQPEELEYFVSSLRPSQVSEIGSERWIEQHELLLKLNQQAIWEVATHQEELVKEFLVMNNKLPVLVHEIISVFIWRTKILPKILEATRQTPDATFLLYTIFFHEASAVALMEIVLFHENGCAALTESTIDLIDYCVQSVTQLIGLVHIGHFRDEDSTAILNLTSADELERQKRDTAYKIGLRCLTILSYLADKIDLMPLSAISRFVKVHDTPCLLSEALHCQPWLRNGSKGVEKFIDEKWTIVQGAAIVKVTKIEAQTWFCFRQLLFNSNIMQMYEINEFRQRELAKCQGKLNDQLLDQLPPLIELKQFLCTLQLSGSKSKNKNIILEELPQIKSNLLEAAKLIGFRQIAEQQANKLINLNQNDLMAMATRLNVAYNTDFLEELKKQNPSCSKSCGLCEADASKKCSKCEQVYYCSRECQIKHWPSHKDNCCG